MNHLDAERLAAHALDPAETLTPEEQAHLAECDRCAGELAELRSYIEIADPDRTGSPLSAPPAGLWDAIVADLAAAPASAEEPAEPPAAPVPEPAVPARAGRSGARRRWTYGLVAALVGILIGVLGTVAVRALQAPSETVVSEVALQPLPGKSGTGEATLVQTPDGLQLRVTLSGVEVHDADLEVWLINTDGVQMRSLGLSGTGGGTFTVPSWMIPDNYRIVDVSVEPRDGQHAHSTNSEVRGTLP